MSAANPCTTPVARSCARSVLARRGAGYPVALALLWPAKLTAAGVLKSAKGVAPTFTDTPTLSAGGVVPGDGPSFTDVVTWPNGGTLVVEFTATTASADLVGDVQVFGPLYACSTGLMAKDGVNTASVAASWGVGDVVTALVQVDALLGMRVGDSAGFGGYAAFDATMSALSLASTAPGDLKQVQTWSKVASAKEIGKIKA